MFKTALSVVLEGPDGENLRVSGRPMDLRSLAKALPQGVIIVSAEQVLTSQDQIVKAEEFLSCQKR